MVSMKKRIQALNDKIESNWDSKDRRKKKKNYSEHTHIETNFLFVAKANNNLRIDKLEKKRKKWKNHLGKMWSLNRKKTSTQNDKHTSIESINERKNRWCRI